MGAEELDLSTRDFLCNTLCLFFIMLYFVISLEFITKFSSLFVRIFT